MGAALKSIDSVASAAAMLEPVRLKLLGALTSPDSASGIARRLGLPRQKTNYHLRELEKAGLVEFVEERRKGNCTERIVRAVARSYVINPAMLGELGADPSRVEDRASSAYLVAAATRVVRDVAELRGRADRAGKSLATITIEAEVRFASAADRNAFAEDLANEIAKLVAEYHDESSQEGRLHRFVIGGYPAITKPEAPGTETPGEAGGRTGGAA